MHKIIYLSLRTVLGAVIVSFIGTAGVFVYEITFEKKRREKLIKEIERLQTGLSSKDAEIKILKHQVKTLKSKRKNKPSSPKTMEMGDDFKDYQSPYDTTDDEEFFSANDGTRDSVTEEIPVQPTADNSSSAVPRPSKNALEL